MPPSNAFSNAAFNLAMATFGQAAHHRLLAQARDPEAAQAATLRAILHENAHTEQGRRLGLANIRTPDEFRRTAPIHDYEDIRPAIERQIQTGAHAIAPERPIMYARSSGTTGAAKYIPVTRRTLAQAREAQRAMAYAQHTTINPFSGRIVGLAGARQEEMLADGAPAGAATGLIYETMPRFMRAKYVAPSEVFAISDYALRYRRIAQLAAHSPDISVIAAANPSSILRLMDAARANLDAIAADAPPARARELRALCRRAETVTLADLWPRLRAVVTWLGGGCANAASMVREQLPAGAAMVDAGYAASEMRGTVVMDVDRNLALPTLGQVFFEFAPVEDWDQGQRRTLLLHELKPQRDYHIIVTTSAGLVRYHMNDVMRVSGAIEATPTLQFIRKGRGVTNITGEKISEDQIHAAMAQLPAAARFYVVLADTRANCYRAFVETTGEPAALAAMLDAQLAHLNIEYQAKRASGRLAPLHVTLLRPGAADAYHRHCVEHKRQREAQIKVQALQTAHECDFDFNAFGTAHA